MGLAGTVVEVVSDLAQDLVHNGFERRGEVGRAHAPAQENYGIGFSLAHGAVVDRETIERVHMHVGVANVCGIEGDATGEDGRSQRRVEHIR